VPPPATPAPEPDPDLPDIADALTGDPQFSMYVGLLDAAGWDGAVGNLAPITVFAPTNQALEALGQDVLAEVRADPSVLADLLRGTVVGGIHTAASLASTTSLTTLAGTTVPVSSTGGTIRVGTATVGGPEVLADNGVIQPLTAIDAPQPR
jgi:uncharacterized surface protein with fasciclin (FAS1) repeats